MRPDRDFARRLAAVTLLLAVGVVPFVADAHVLSTDDPCSDACPTGDDCDGGTGLCGCCARIAPAVVPVAVATTGPPRAPAPADGDPTVAELAVVELLLDPPRPPVS